MRLFSLWIGLPSLIIHAPAHATGQGLLAERDFSVPETGSPGATVHALTNGKADMVVATLASMAQLRGGEVEHLRIVQEIATVPRLVFSAHPDGTPSTRLAEQ